MSSRAQQALSFAKGANPNQINWAGIPAGSQAEASLAAAGYKRPAAPAPAAPAVLPFSNTTAANNSAAQANFNVEDLGPGGFEDQLSQLQFGYSDPTNPFDQLKLMQKAYDNRVRGNTNSLAARGQLYSGALQNAQNDANTGFQEDQSAALQRYNAAVAAIKGKKQLASQNVTNTASTGLAGQLDAALQGGS